MILKRFVQKSYRISTARVVVALIGVTTFINAVTKEAKGACTLETITLVLAFCILNFNMFKSDIKVS